MQIGVVKGKKSAKIVLITLMNTIVRKIKLLDTIITIAIITIKI